MLIYIIFAVGTRNKRAEELIHKRFFCYAGMHLRKIAADLLSARYDSAAFILNKIREEEFIESKNKSGYNYI